jgi:hypothetical protein
MDIETAPSCEAIPRDAIDSRLAEWCLDKRYFHLALLLAIVQKDWSLLSKVAAEGQGNSTAL